MIKEEFNLLHEIDSQWESFKTESDDHYVHGQGVVKPSGYLFVRKAKDLSQSIHNLSHDFHPDYYLENWGGVNSTLNDEVRRVEFAEERANKSHATKRDKDDFYSSMANVIGHFSRDYIGVFNKIAEMKRDGQWENHSKKDAKI